MNTYNRPKYALITGASRGIGRAAAEIFAENGYHLFLTCHNSMDELEHLAESLQSAHEINCLAVRADMGIETDVARLFTHIQHLDVLVNNAGMAYFGLLSEMTASQWHRIMAVNLDSCFYTCRAAIPLMLKNHRGSIVNVSSVWGAQGASMEAAYSASKGGMNAFTKALAKELAPSGIQVNAIACGMIDTAMNACFTPEEIQSICEEIPAGRMASPEETAEFIALLLKAPNYLTGQVIGFDGGW